MNKARTAAKYGIGLLAAAGILAASPAYATTLDAYTAGAHVWSHGQNSEVAVKDTLADSASPYALYYRRNIGSKLRLENHSGYGTTAYSASNYTNRVTEIKACRDLNLEPDNCSGWV